MNDLYLYFRTSSTLADDDTDHDSCCWPLSSLTGMRSLSSGGDQLVELRFKSVNTNMDGDGTGGMPTDRVYVYTKSFSATTHGYRAPELQRSLVEAFNSQLNKSKKFLVVGDDTTNNYLNGHVKYLGGITVTNRPS
jgi:hypothetical protein